MKNNTRKQTILDVSRTLFYQNGMEDTSLDAIAKKCGIQKQLITYYFGTKEALCDAVAQEYRSDILEEFLKVGQLLDIDTHIIAAAFSVFVSRYYKEDENARRFFTDLLGSRKMSLDLLQERFDSLKNSSSEILKKDIDFVDYVTSHYGAYWLMYHYCRDEISIPSEVFERKYLELVAGSLIESPQVFEEIYDKATSLLNSLSIAILPDFRIKITLKNTLKYV